MKNHSFTKQKTIGNNANWAVVFFANWLTISLFGLQQYQLQLFVVNTLITKLNVNNNHHFHSIITIISPEIQNKVTETQTTTPRLRSIAAKSKCHQMSTTPSQNWRKTFQQLTSSSWLHIIWLSHAHTHSAIHYLALSLRLWLLPLPGIVF